jgi:hypothetical protein
MATDNDNPPAGHVAVNLLCDQCGYNLRTLATDARCPECSYPVAETLRPDDLRYAPYPYVRKLANGCSLLSAAALMLLIDAVLFTTIGIVLASGYDDDARTSPSWLESAGEVLEVLMPILAAVAFASAIIGSVLITNRDHRRRARHERLSARRALRIGVLAAIPGAAWVFLQILLEGVLPIPLWLGILGYLLSLLLVVAINPGILAYHLRNLAGRLGNKRLTGLAQGLVVYHFFAMFLLVILFFGAVETPAGATGLSLLFATSSGFYTFVLLHFTHSLHAAAHSARTHAATLSTAAASRRESTPQTD